MIEMKRAMGMAVEQIRRLRHENEVLRAKVETMELLAGFLHAQMPSLRGGGMEEDAAWLLQRELEKMEKADQPEKEAGQPAGLGGMGIAANQVIR